MAPMPPLKLPELTIGNGGMPYESKQSGRMGKGCLWFLTAVAINLCVTAILAGLTVTYVNKELQSVRDKFQLYDERLAWLEDASSKPDAVRIRPHVPSVDGDQLRRRRNQDGDESTDRHAKPNATLLSNVVDYGTRGMCSCRDGRDGRDGEDGGQGLTGPQGPKGEKGDIGVDEKQALPAILGPRRYKRTVDDTQGGVTTLGQGQDTKVPSGGDTYVRWGRTTCPNEPDTELVYAGTAAGSHYSHKGGSTDFWCLPSRPDWAASYSDTANSHSYLYGVEYEVAYDPFSHDNTDVVNQRDVPCAVCRLLRRSTQLLLPATLGCPDSNWTEEYRGFMMSGRHNEEQRSRAICVDQAPEAVPGSQANVDGARLYIMEGQCGSLLCPPYVAGREITCTVCSI